MLKREFEGDDGVAEGLGALKVQLQQSDDKFRGKNKTLSAQIDELREELKYAEDRLQRKFHEEIDQVKKSGGGKSKSIEKEKEKFKDKDKDKKKKEDKKAKKKDKSRRESFEASLDLDESKEMRKKSKEMKIIETDPASPGMSPRSPRSPAKGFKRQKSLRKTSRKKLPTNFAEAVDGEVFSASQLKIIEGIVDKRIGGENNG